MESLTRETDRVDNNFLRSEKVADEIVLKSELFLKIFPSQRQRIRRDGSHHRDQWLVLNRFQFDSVIVDILR